MEQKLGQSLSATKSKTALGQYIPRKECNFFSLRFFLNVVHYAFKKNCKYVKGTSAK